MQPRSGAQRSDSHVCRVRSRTAGRGQWGGSRRLSKVSSVPQPSCTRLRMRTAAIRFRGKRDSPSSSCRNSRSATRLGAERTGLRRPGLRAGGAAGTPSNVTTTSGMRAAGAARTTRSHRRVSSTRELWTSTCPRGQRQSVRAIPPVRRHATSTGTADLTPPQTAAPTSIAPLCHRPTPRDRRCAAGGAGSLASC